jgi:quinol monooxygenase YgiN
MHLHPLLLVAAVVVSAAVTTVPPASAAEPATAAAYGVLYFEVGMPSAKTAARLLGQLVEATHKEPENVAFLGLSEIGRPDRLAIFGAFRDAAALEAHRAGPADKEFRSKIGPMLAAPPDRRELTAVSVAAPAVQGGRRAVYVVTHVDVVPTFKDRARALLEDLAAGARKEPGNLFFDVLVQNNRANHFTVIAAWRNRRDFEAHAMTAPTREFRQELLPMQGALYDERLYRAVP